MRRGTGRILLTLTWLVSGPTWNDAFGQERSIDVSVGRIVFDRVPAAVDAPPLAGRPSHVMLTFRDMRRARSWLQASAAAPVVDDALAWGVVGAGGRFLWPDAHRRVRAGADVAAQGYAFREPAQRVTGTGGVAEVHGVTAVRAGVATIESRLGWRGQTLSFAGSSSTRRVVEAGARVTVPGRVRLDAESKWVRAPEGVSPFVGATLFAYGRAPVYGWVQAGRWFGAAPFDAVAWSAGIGYTLGTHTRLWMNLRQDAPDPLYQNAARRTWTVGLTRRIGGRAPRVTIPVEAAVTPVTIRIRVAEAPPGLVSIAGTFNAWQPQPMVEEGDEWVARLTLAPGVYDYAFRSANGEWFVPASVPGRRSDGMGGYSARLVIP